MVRWLIINSRKSLSVRCRTFDSLIVNTHSWIGSYTQSSLANYFCQDFWSQLQKNGAEHAKKAASFCPTNQRNISIYNTLWSIIGNDGSIVCSITPMTTTAGVVSWFIWNYLSKWRQAAEKSTNFDPRCDRKLAKKTKDRQFRSATLSVWRRNRKWVAECDDSRFATHWAKMQQPDATVCIASGCGYFAMFVDDETY